MAVEPPSGSEASYHILFEAAGDAILVGGDGFVDCNSRALALFGVSKEQLIGKMYWDFAPGAQPDGVPSRVHAQEHIALALAGETTQFEWQGRRADGTIFDADVTLSPVTLNGAAHHVGLLREVTGRKRVERENQTRMELLLAERSAQLDAANQELESFSYSISHDLRAAIRGIGACSQIVLNECGAAFDASARQWLEYIHADTEQLDKLTLALLGLSRVSRSEMHRAEVDLAAISRTVTERLAESEPDRKARWRIGESLPAWGDPALLQTAMENLIGNAWKFSKNRDVTEIEIGFVDSATKGRVYFVRDNGIGFDMRYAGKLFGAFQRLHRNPEFDGAGIGLATVRRIVHRHGGRVWAEGVVDAGATVFFTLGRPSSA